MKKIFVFLLITICSVLLFGCQPKSNINDYFSEITRVYYNGTSSDGKMSGSISVGEREEPYIVDGKHNKLCDFSLLVLSFRFRIDANEISVNFQSGANEKTVTLEFNPLNNTYMTDLGYALEEGQTYSINYENYSFIFEKVNDGFSLDFQEAINKSIDVLGDKIQNYYNGNNFLGECYLKILSKPDGYFKDLYWVFTIVGQDDKSNNVILDIKDGSLVISN